MWSGQMAFPGGRASEEDPTPQAVAAREAQEEVGLDLSHADFIGALDEHSLRRIADTDATLCPFVYVWPSGLPRLRPEPTEVAEAYWTPLDHLWDAANGTIVPWTHQGIDLRFPGIRHGDDVVWGLTLRVLTALAELAGRPLPLRIDGPR